MEHVQHPRGSQRREQKIKKRSRFWCTESCSHDTFVLREEIYPVFYFYFLEGGDTIRCEISASVLHPCFLECWRRGATPPFA